MVNNSNVRLLVRGACATRRNAKGRIKIDNGPVYDLAITKRMLAAHGLVVVNEDAEEDMNGAFIPALEPDELTAIIQSLDEGRHFVESERCRTTNGMEIDADAYAIYWNRNKRIESTSVGTKTFVKFGFREMNPQCLIVSIHPSNH